MRTVPRTHTLLLAHATTLLALSLCLSVSRLSSLFSLAISFSFSLSSLPSHPFASRRQDHPDELASDPYVGFVYQMLLYLVKRVAEGSSQDPLTPPTPTPFATAVARSEKNGRGGMGFAGKGAGVSDLSLIHI